MSDTPRTDGHILKYPWLKDEEPETVEVLRMWERQMAAMELNGPYAEALTATFQIKLTYSGIPKLIVTAPNGDCCEFKPNGERAERVLREASAALAAPSVAQEPERIPQVTLIQGGWRQVRVPKEPK